MKETFKFKQNIIGKSEFEPVNVYTTIAYLLGLVLFVFVFLYIYQYSINYSFLFAILSIAALLVFTRLVSINDKLVVEDNILHINQRFRTRVIDIDDIISVSRNIKVVNLDKTGSGMTDYQSRPVGYLIKLNNEIISVLGELEDENEFISSLRNVNNRIPSTVLVDKNQLHNSNELVTRYNRNYKIIHIVGFAIAISVLGWLYISNKL